MSFNPIEFASGMAKVINEKFDIELKPLRDRIAKLEAERANSLRYVGIWESTRQYDVGEVVSHSGGMWHCNVRTTQRPGNGSGDWTLCVKSGQSR